MPRAFDEPVLSQVSEVLRNLGLRKFKDLLKMADAQRPVGEQVNDSQPRRITKALVNLGSSPRLHEMAGAIYSSTTIFSLTLYFSLADIHSRAMRYE